MHVLIGGAVKIPDCFLSWTEVSVFTQPPNRSLSCGSRYHSQRQHRRRSLPGLSFQPLVINRTSYRRRHLCRTSQQSSPPRKDAWQIFAKLKPANPSNPSLALSTDLPPIPSFLFPRDGSSELCKHPTRSRRLLLPSLHFAPSYSHSHTLSLTRTGSCRTTRRAVPPSGPV